MLRVQGIRVRPVNELAAGPLFRFADWPNEQVPRRAAGVYTVWRETPLFMRA